MPSILERYRDADDNKENHEKAKTPVYYVESSGDDTVLVGIDVKIHRLENGSTIVSWFDTVRERSMSAEEIRDENNYFAFKRAEEEGGQVYRFTPMDLKLYDEKVRDKLLSKKEFSSTEEMYNAFNNIESD